MKNRQILFLLSFIIWFSCKTETSKSNTTTSKSNTTIKSTSSSFDISISTAEGNLIGSYNLNPIKISSNNANYTYKSKPDKHKFYTNGSMKYEVKFKEDAIKLRDKNSNLLWKVKIYPDKIKISDNEENANGFVVRPYEDKIKIKRNEEELYRVNIEGTSIKVNDKATYTLSSEQNSYLYAILAINEIPNEHKLFILAELLNKI